jgi:hypothetical protein
MPLTHAEARFIFDNDLGCRYGVTIDGAAYGFMDIVGHGQDGHDPGPTMQEVMRWLSNPNSHEFQPRWDDRLWNTCGVIVSLSPAGTVILVSRAVPTAERYLFADPLHRGDGYSFRKNNRLPPNAQILATIPYGEGHAAAEREDIGPMPENVQVSKEQVEELCGKVQVALAKLAK